MPSIPKLLAAGSLLPFALPVLLVALGASFLLWPLALPYVLFRAHRAYGYYSRKAHSAGAGPPPLSSASVTRKVPAAFRATTIVNKQHLPLYTVHAAAGAAKEEPQGVLFLVHGLAEHCMRYTRAIEEWNRRGFVVFAMDHQGHGRSGGDRAHVEAFDDFVDDYVQFIDHVHATVPAVAKLPHFLFGHSLGGLIAVHVAARRPEMWNGVLLSGPALEPDPAQASPLLIAVGGFLASRLPKLGLTYLPSDGVSRDMAIRAEYVADPLVYHGPVRLNLAFAILNAMEYAKHALAADAKYSFWLGHGSADVLTRPSGSREFFAASPSDDKTIHLYEGLFHELLNEPEKEKILAEMIDWMDARL